MACPQLQLTSEIFGDPITPVLSASSPQKGQWVGLGHTLNTPTTADTLQGVFQGVAVTVTDSSVADTVDLAVTAGNAAGAVTIRRQGASGSLLAARFGTGAGFLVVCYSVSVLGAQTSWTFVVFDLAVSGTSKPIVLGPYPLPTGHPMNFCPNASGRLVLLWSADPAGPKPTTCAVFRTDVDAASSADALVANGQLTAAGALACKVETSPAPGTISVYDHAGGAALTASSTLVASSNVPRPGQLELSTSTLLIPAAGGPATFVIHNVGGSLLELTSITRTGTAISLAAMGRTLPVCLRPRESFPVTVTRTTTGAATSTVTVSTNPVSSHNTVTVTLDTLVPDPRATWDKDVMTWQVGDTKNQSVTITNIGNVPLSVGYSRLPMGSAFTLSGTPGATIGPGERVSVDVTPPTSCGPAAITSSFRIGVELSPPRMGAPNISGFPITVSLTACVPKQVKVPPGALRISTILSDAPGDDILPEGEFIEILNETGSSLDLTGCQVQDRMVSAAGAPGIFNRPFFTFGPAAFGVGSELPPGQIVRVLTRARQAADADRPFVVFAGLAQAVWNNIGDTARVLDEDGTVVAEQTYVTSPPTPGTTLPPGTIYTAPRARSRTAVRRVYVNVQTDWTDVFEVEDGDLVTITAAGTARFGLFGNVFDANGSTGQIAPGDQGWPLAGVAPFCLIGSLGGYSPFLVGAATTMTFNRNSPALMLRLGPNDGELWDNAGQWDCLATLYR